MVCAFYFLTSSLKSLLLKEKGSTVCWFSTLVSFARQNPLSSRRGDERGEGITLDKIKTKPPPQSWR
jgi:hypothetical protein